MARPPSSPLRSFFVLLLLGVLLGTLALVVRSHLLMRQNPGRPMSAAMRETLDPEIRQLTAEDERVIAEKFPGARLNKSGLRQIVRAPGAGPPPRSGQTVALRYEGRLLDGTVFDGKRARGEPFKLKAGGGSFGRGWDEALLTMKPGEKRTLLLPWWLGPFGAEGSEPAVPPRAVLVYEVELVGVE